MLDADGYFLAGKVRRVVEEFEKDPEVGTIYHPWWELGEQSGKLRETRWRSTRFLSDDKEKRMRFTAQQTLSLAFRRRVMEQVMSMPESMRIHADAFVELLAVLLAPVAIDEALAVYRVHGENLSYGIGRSRLRKRSVAGWRCTRRCWRRLPFGMAAHKNQLSGIDTRGYIELQIWKMQSTQYLADPPGRWWSFWFMARGGIGRT
jgi:hypothetical protein